jgi:hypothetical protein
LFWKYWATLFIFSSLKKLANSYKNSIGIALSIFEPLTDVD